MTSLTSLLAGLKKVSSTSNGEWAGPCPWCGGEDRFRFWPDHPSGAAGGRFMCRGCGRQGDAIQFLRDYTGMSYAEACTVLGTLPKASTKREAKPGRGNWKPEPSSLPGKKWREAARRFLEALPPGGDYARGRGLTDATIATWQIKWTPADQFQDREAWGLPPETNPKTGKARKVWLPAGLVLPTIRDGGIVALKIRRAGWSVGDSLPKYVAASGSAQGPLVLADKPGLDVAVVESELDAFLLAQEAGDLVSVLAMRTARGKPDAAAHAMLKAAPCILVALDFDEAGAKGWPWWRKQYRRSMRWPVPAGKDVGDLPGLGVPIRDWILAASPSTPPCSPPEVPAEAPNEQATIPPVAEAHKPRPKPASRPEWQRCRAKGCAAWIGGPPGLEIAWRCLGEHFHGDVDFEAASFPKIKNLDACPWLN